MRDDDLAPRFHMHSAFLLGSSKKEGQNEDTFSWLGVIGFREFSFTDFKLKSLALNLKFVS